MYSFNNITFANQIRPFKALYKCYSVSMLPTATTGRNNDDREGRIFLPHSALNHLTRLNIVYPMLFKLTNRAKDRTTHCAFLEFVADEGKCYMPHWMMRNLLLEEGALIDIESVSLPVITYSEFQQQANGDLSKSEPAPLLGSHKHARKGRTIASYHNVNGHPKQRKSTKNNEYHQNNLTYKYPPFFITFISIFQLVSFVYYALRSDEPLTLTGPVPYQSKLIYNPQRRYEIWRYITYMFIHAGYWHISFNILIQLAVGIPLEIVHKFEPIFIIYLGGIVGGALGNSLADPHSFLAGASSGCYALIAAHISNLIINWSEIKGACCRLFTLLLFTSCDLGTAIYERHGKVDLRPYKTSYGGHLAGALSGLLLGLIFLRNVRAHDWERDVTKWAMGIYIILMVFAIVFNLTNPDYFPLPDRRDLVWTSSPFGYEREQ